MINVAFFDFEIVNFPFLDGDVPRALRPMESISLNSSDFLEHIAMLLIQYSQ